MTADALELRQLGRSFDTVLDCGLFHTFGSDERSRYLAGLASVTGSGATLHVLCLSDEGPDVGPHPVGRDELAAAFDASAGWRLVAVRPDRIETRMHATGASAWLATAERIPN